MKDVLDYPFDFREILMAKRELRKKFSSHDSYLEKKVAILGGSTTAEVRDLLDLFLLQKGIKASFYESSYNRYYEEAVFDSAELDQFNPDLVFIHTSVRNLFAAPQVGDSKEAIDGLVSDVLDHFSTVWDRLTEKFNCTIIQNNFELPAFRSLGNIDGVDGRGLTTFVGKLNDAFADKATERQSLIINDIHYLSAQIGLDRWHDTQMWHAYKYALSHEGMPYLANQVAGIASAAFGKSNKCLVLDLDNTLWGGVIGDDGVDGIRIGSEGTEAAAYLEFQKYILALKERGIILAVCSKNEHENALEGLNHPDCLLKPDDFAVIQANWEPKAGNIEAIAETINIGKDSLVFVDDNPVERKAVREWVPEVTVVEPDGDIASYIRCLDRMQLFETVGVASEDLARSQYYVENAKRAQVKKSFSDYGDFLDSLEMTMQVSGFEGQYQERITQLTNKTNQFNLTTKRCSSAEVAEMENDANTISLCARLTDKFGDNGIISVMVGSIEDAVCSIDLWLMSCRVFKREAEYAMFDVFVEHALRHGVKELRGTYKRTPKNDIVSKLYEELGFECEQSEENDESRWTMVIGPDYKPMNKHIKVEQI
ncbi:HAD-IIIC family phosphatase [Pseudodesulfovibrio sp. zrk46]|uniref:HAD-IIIC family phosphatase n=1 Tax=Pseudodesulfovibrio sp. zrk46 TaxID=2725288 RepID=UPI0014490FE3|nr:HAD-IIIC family phosphatase [Pseudodesulfovibrio sp. zrk46]QJB56587.1 HAD-IIIC family phosphatase [Pseudodesulfovibrio sp. zrk46]